MPYPKPYHEGRPWGNFTKFTENTPSTVKILTINPGENFSLQFHHDRDEFWYVISGEGQAEIGDQIINIKTNDELFAPRGTNHRIKAGSLPVVILEISFGQFSESDITRIDDKYGRK